MSVTKETATVYRGGDRRYLTKRAAYYAEARKRWRVKYDGLDRCQCEPDVGYVCNWHEYGSTVHQRAVIVRYARMLQIHDQQEEQYE